MTSERRTANDFQVYSCSELDTCSDMLPINLVPPICLYLAAVIPLAVTTYIPREPECYLHPGHTFYRISIDFIFFSFCAQVGTEVLTVLISLRGIPSSAQTASSLLIHASFKTAAYRETSQTLPGLHFSAGTPLQTRKRFVAEYLLMLTYVINLVQLAGTSKWVP